VEVHTSLGVRKEFIYMYVLPSKRESSVSSEHKKTNEKRTSVRTKMPQTEVGKDKNFTEQKGLFGFKCCLANQFRTNQPGYNQMAVQLLSSRQKRNERNDTSAIYNIASTGVRGTGHKLPYYDKVQAAFGQRDISHIKAYTGSEAATASRAIDAKAYTMGNKIAFAEINPDLHTVVHETAHVFQQAKGVQLKSGLGEVGDRYEQQADEIANAAVQGKSAENILDKQVNNGTSASIKYVSNNRQSKVAIQRKMGFEFETAQNTFEKLDRKDVAYVDNKLGFRLEADTGHHLEFITKPYATWRNLNAAIQGAVGLAETLPNGRVTKNKDDGWMDDNIVMNIKDPTFRASVQSTEGVMLKNFESLMTEHLSGDRNWDPKGIIEKSSRLQDLDPGVRGLFQVIIMYIEGAQKIRPSKDGPKGHFPLMARTDFHSMYKSLKKNEQDQFRNVLESGFISTVTGVALDTPLFKKGYWSGTDDRGQSFIEAAEGPTLGEWLASIKLGNRDIALMDKEVKLESGKTMFKMFRDPDEKYNKIQKKYKNKVFGTGFHKDLRRQKDLLSPPPGLDAHHLVLQKWRYGMGAYPMDKDLALFEMRGYRFKNQMSSPGSDGKVPKDHWVTFAQTIFNNSVNRDKPSTLAGPSSSSAVSTSESNFEQLMKRSADALEVSKRERGPKSGNPEVQPTTKKQKTTQENTISNAKSKEPETRKGKEKLKSNSKEEKTQNQSDRSRTQTNQRSPQKSVPNLHLGTSRKPRNPNPYNAGPSSSSGRFENLNSYNTAGSTSRNPKEVERDIYRTLLDKESSGQLDWWDQRKLNELRKKLNIDHT
jgi:hypothetical protein